MTRILCIEDEPDIREAITEELQEMGFDTIEAGNGQEGLECIMKDEPDLVLCDINMPIMNGHELLTILREEHPDLAEVPFIFLSANADASHIIAGKKLGADDYLTKPIDFDVLGATVKARLSQIVRIKEKHEKQLIHTQKMEAVGRLTSGVAHEFNNLLTAIRGFSEIALRNVDNHKLVSECLVDNMEAADRAASITSQLLAYSRKQICDTSCVDANSVAGNLDRLLQPLLGPKVTLHMTLAEGPLPCEIDPRQFVQVLMNLTINARDALPGGGEITVSTSREIVSEELALSLPENIPAGNYICFSVKDTGVGIDEATQSKIFEPFFTTKEEGEGTGLGLAVAYGIVRQSKGIIDCESALGEGATFRVYIPELEGGTISADMQEIVELPESARTQHARTQHTSTQDKKIILVVDDEVLVRNAAKMILESLGHRVLMAEDSESAMNISNNHPNGIDLLLCDILLPTNDGPELMEEIHKSGKSIKTIFMSGNVTIMDQNYPGLRDNHPYLEKPFTAGNLEQAISDVFVGG